MSYTVEKLLTPYNLTRTGGREIKYIVLHYFGSLGTAKQVAQYFAGSKVNASAHYTVDEGETVYQCVEDRDIAWHCGDSGKGSLKGVVTNSNSIGIEIRPYILDKSRYQEASYAGWYFTEQVMERALELTRDLMKKYNIPASRVVRHYDVTGKWCPRPWMGGDVNLYYGESGNEQWRKFKNRLQEDEDMLSYEQWRDYMEKYEAEKAQAAPGAWSQEARDWAEKNGILQGDDGGMRYKSNVTREELVTVLQRVLRV